MITLAWAALAALVAAVLLSTHMMRIVACAALTWASAMEEWRDSISRHWERNAAQLLSVPDSDAGNWPLDRPYSRIEFSGAGAEQPAPAEEG